MSVSQPLATRWTAARRDLANAYADRSVRLGLVGTILITLGSHSPAYLPQTSPWWRPIRAIGLAGLPGKLTGTALILVGLALLMHAWFALRPSAYSHRKHWAILAWWSLPFLLAPPIFSHDAYSYAAQGWLLHNGVNPYYAGPGTLPGAFADQVAWVWRFTPAPYGPLSLQLQHLLVDAMGHQPYLSALAMRIPALIGVALIVLLIPRMAAMLRLDPQYAAWFATLNPLLVIDFVGGAHNDSLMMGLVVLALWLTLRQQRWGWLAAAALVGVAAAIKQPALLATYAVALIGHPWHWRWRSALAAFGRVLAAIAITVGVFVAISYATGLEFGWYNAVDVPGMVITVSPATVLGQGVQLILNAFQVDPTGHMGVTVFRTIGLGLAAVIVLGLALTVARTRPFSFLSWAYLAVALGGPALHSWYVLWGALLLPLARPSTRVVRIATWATIVLLCYSAINLAWRNDALALGLAALGAFAWITTEHEKTVPATG